MATKKRKKRMKRTLVRFKILRTTCMFVAISCSMPILGKGPIPVICHLLIISGASYVGILGLPTILSKARQGQWIRGKNTQNILRKNFDLRFSYSEYRLMAGTDSVHLPCRKLYCKKNTEQLRI